MIQRSANRHLAVVDKGMEDKGECLIEHYDSIGAAVVVEKACLGTR